MRKFVCLLFLALLGFVPAAHAQGFWTGAFFGGLAGYAAGGSGEKSPADPGRAVIYMIPRAPERVKNPLGVRMGAIWLNFDDGPTHPSGQPNSRGAKGVSLWELFRRVEPRPEKYEILEVVRVMTAGGTQGSLIFAYLEREQVTPLDKLSPAPTSNK